MIILLQKIHQPDVLRARSGYPASKSGYIPSTTEIYRNAAWSMVPVDALFFAFWFPLIVHCSTCNVLMALTKHINQIVSKLLASEF